MTSEICSGASSSQSSAHGASRSNSVHLSVQKSYVEMLEEWFVALYEEDSRRLRELLEIHPALWEVGWEPDSSREVEGRPRNYWMKVEKSDWKGRTALHVGARRGNVDLLQKVLGLCRNGANAKGIALRDRPLSGQDSPVNDPFVNGKARDFKVPSAISKGDGDGKERSMERFLLATDGEYKLDAIAMAIVNGNPVVVALILQAGSACKPVKDKYKINLVVGGQDNLNKDVGGSDEPKKDVHVRTQVDQKYLDIIQELQKDPDLSEATRQYINILKKDSVGKVASESEGQKDRDKTTMPDLWREDLKRATRQVIANFEKDVLFETFILKRYDLHRDFNFLSKEEFLFHFLSTEYHDAESDHLIPDLRVNIGGRIRYLYFVVQYAIMRAVASTTPKLMLLLWKLHDGQGRPPLHVAVDEMIGPSSMLLNLVRASAVDKKVVKEIMEARDGVGRTALHRSIAIGGAVFPRSEEVDYFGDVKEKLKCFAIDVRIQLQMVVALQQRPQGDGDRKLEHEIENILNGLVCNEPGEQRYGSGRVVEQTATEIATNLPNGLRKIFAYDEAVLNLVGARESNVRPMATLRSGISYYLDEQTVSSAQGFTGRKGPQEEFARAPLHSAIIHKNWSACETLTEMIMKDESSSLRDQRIIYSYWPMVDRVRWKQKHVIENLGYLTFTCLELAVVVGDIKILRTLLKIKQPSRSSYSNQFSALQVAAALGKHEMLQLLLERNHNPFQLDSFANSALHYALGGLSVIDDNYLKVNRVLEKREQAKIFSVYLTDYVSCEQILKTEKERKRHADDNNDRERVNNDEVRVERERCINLLIQEGYEIFQTNYENKCPHPKKDANIKFRSWWEAKQATELATAQRAESTAANAISVIATLIATASYVGPLQPPLGYTDNDQPELQLGITAVRVFIICDTMSFYLAIATIIAALVPCLPMLQQSMIDELRRTRDMNSMAVAMLFPSIICILMAFAAASIAVIQTDQTAWNRGGLTKGTAIVGGFFCLIMIVIFSIRILTILFRGSKLMRKIYEITSFNKLDDIVRLFSLCAYNPKRLFSRSRSLS